MSDTTPAPLVHIIGPPIQLGPVRRQRCVWCGLLVDELDLSGIAWTLNEDGSDPGPPAPWPVGGLVRVIVHGDAVSSYAFVDHKDGDPLPDDACGRLPDDLTRGPSTR